MLFFSVIFGILYISFICLSFFKKLNYIYFIITLFIVGSPIQTIVYTQAWLIKYYLIFIGFISILLIINQLNHNDYPNTKNIISSLKNGLINKINTKKLVVPLLITIVLTYKSFPYLWRFEAHDVAYFSWLNGILNIDYFGPLRLPTAYPTLLSANHLLTGTLLIPFTMLLKPINLFNVFFIKYLLIFSSYLYYVQAIYLSSLENKERNSNIIFTIFISLITFLTFSSELDYLNATSSYLLLILLFTMCGFLIRSNSYRFISESEQINIFLFIFYSLLISKATTFLVFTFGYLIFIFISNKKSILSLYKKVNKKVLILISGLIIITFLSWIIPQSNHGTLTFSFPLCLFDFRENISSSKCIFSLFSNPFLGWVVPGLKTSLIEIFGFSVDISTFLYIWIICLLPCILSGIYLSFYSNNKLYKFYGKFSYCYSLSTLFAITFFRNSENFSGDHSAHAFLISIIFTITCFSLIFLENQHKLNINKKINFSFLMLIPLITILNIFDGHMISNREKVFFNLNELSKERISISFLESKKFDNNLCTTNSNIIKKFGTYLDSNGCGKSDLGELKYSLEGIRTDISLDSESSIIKEWSIK